MISVVDNAFNIINGNIISPVLDGYSVYEIIIFYLIFIWAILNGPEEEFSIIERVINLILSFTIGSVIFLRILLPVRNFIYFSVLVPIINNYPLFQIAGITIVFALSLFIIFSYEDTEESLGETMGFSIFLSVCIVILILRVGADLGIIYTEFVSFYIKNLNAYVISGMSLVLWSFNWYFHNQLDENYAGAHPMNAHEKHVVDESEHSSNNVFESLLILVTTVVGIPVWFVSLRVVAEVSGYVIRVFSLTGSSARSMPPGALYVSSISVIVITVYYFYCLACATEMIR